LIAFQTVNPETNVETQSGNPVTLPQGNFFVSNAFLMIGALAGGVLLIGTILGLWAISTGSRNQRKGLYGEDEGRRPRKLEDTNAEPPMVERGGERGEIQIQPQPVKKICGHCGAEVPLEALICRKCGMPAYHK
jgi:hypothetical protein